MKHSIEAVLFDVGGVLVEVTGAATLRSWMGNVATLEETSHLWLYSPSVRAFETGRTEDPTVFAKDLVSEFRLPLGPEAFLKEFQTWTPGLFPGALELVHGVTRRVRRASLWNSNPIHWPPIMDQMGLSQCFDRDFASHLTGKIKPDREAFEHAICEMNCPPEAIVFVDDNQINVDAAEALGLRAHRTRGAGEARAVLSAYGLVEDETSR